MLPVPVLVVVFFRLVVVLPVVFPVVVFLPSEDFWSGLSLVPVSPPPPVPPPAVLPPSLSGWDPSGPSAEGPPPPLPSSPRGGCLPEPVRGEGAADANTPGMSPLPEPSTVPGASPLPTLRKPLSPPPVWTRNGTVTSSTPAMAAPARSALFGRPTFSGASPVVVAVPVAMEAASSSAAAVAVAVAPSPSAVAGVVAAASPSAWASASASPSAVVGELAASPAASVACFSFFFPADSSAGVDGFAPPVVPPPFAEAAEAAGVAEAAGAVRGEVPPVASAVACTSDSEVASVSSFLDVVMESSG